ncbi:TonB-dependent receptor [uncultured Sphingomonas sp.]|uniref:TonB-dependent receptor n=1 Tax=uncultured Sphingomonas sp. TaxID=158754 RepID=UPI0025E002E0|nr:TonB-dependent receptor [uncultured Sphingomonas sp.]
MRLRTIVWCGAALGALSLGSAMPATAQTAVAPVAAPIPPDQVPGTTATAQAASEQLPASAAASQDIIVTATRRSESLRDVPIAITAISGEQVKEARITNFIDVPAILPGATFVSTKGPSTASIAIRGQSQSNDSPHLDIPVAVFQDDIYFGTLASFASDFFDLDQLAILRGPQGTTFGRNVVGGVLQITSNRARLGQNDGEINVTLSNFATNDAIGIDTQGFFNVATSDTSAARLAYSVKHVPGYYDNRTTGTHLANQRSVALRPTFTWEPSDTVKLGLLGQYFHENGLPSGYRSVGQGALQARCDAIRRSPWDVCHDVDGKNERTIWLGQIRADIDLGAATLASISSYRHLDSDYRDDGDSSPLPLNIGSLNASRESQFSQELRLTSQGSSKLEYVGGIYVSRENLRKQINFGFNGTIPGTRLATLTRGQLQQQTVIGISHVTSAAAFLEGKYHFTDALALTVGGRYTIEHKTGSTDHIGASAFYGAAYSVDDLRDTWRAFTPRAVLEFKPRRGLLFYGSVARGFKGGGWSLTSTSAAAARTPLEPENSTSYELGAKLRLFDALDLNIAAYHADTTNLQVRSLDNGVFTDTNAGKLRVKGVEVESVLRLSPSFNVTANYAYTDAYYASFEGCAAGGTDCTGNAAPFTPKNDITFGGHFRNDLGGGKLTVDATAQWASKFSVGPLNNQPFAESRTDRNGVVNASIGYEFPDGLTKVILFGRNLTNTWSFSSASNFNFYFLTQAEFAAGANEVDRGPITPPRQIGLTITRRF